MATYDPYRKRKPLIAPGVIPESKASLTPPTVDLGRIEGLTQEFAAPVVSQARRGLRESLRLRPSENPAARAMFARQALEGFGSTIGQAVSGARSQAESVYGKEYQAEFESEKGRYQEEVARERAALDEERWLRMQEYTQQQQRDQVLPSTQRSARLTSELSPQQPQGLPGYQPTAEGRAPTQTGPQVNPAYWPKGYQQQQKAEELSKQHDIPLKYFQGDKDPEQAIESFLFS